MIDEVSLLLREVAEQVILPRFKRLTEGDIRLKSPGEDVTIADEEAERLLTIALSEIAPGSIVVGEEAVARRPDRLAGIATGTVWLVDPLDGTTNFIEGSACFSTMVAMLRDGEVVASWMLSPATGILQVAEKGSGAQVNGRPVRCGVSPPWEELRGSVLTRFLPAELRTNILGKMGTCREILPGLRCAGEEYPAIVRGMQNFSVYWRTLPWDHAAGVLFLEEAGGKAARFDGRPYKPAEQGFGLLAAQTAELWSELHSKLFAEIDSQI